MKFAPVVRAALSVTLALTKIEALPEDYKKSILTNDVFSNYN